MEINQGSIETMVVKVKDALGTIAALPSAVFDIYDTDGNLETANIAATVDGMTAFCRIDATALTAKDYDLFLKFSIAGDSPILGPHRFRVQ